MALLLLSLPVNPLRTLNDILPWIRTDYLSLSVLLLAFKAPKDPPDRTDVQQIIQWKMFGDKDHTGNGMYIEVKDASSSS